MEPNELKKTIDQYKRQMLSMYEKAIPTVASAPVDDTYEQFIKYNSEIGTLKIQAFTAQQALPVENVHVIVKKEFVDQTKIFFDGFTNLNGIIDNLQLPAPKKSFSEDENYRGLTYSTYDIEATHPEYQKVNLDQVTIFNGIKSIQPINLTPKR